LRDCRPSMKDEPASLWRLAVALLRTERPTLALMNWRPLARVSPLSAGRNDFAGKGGHFAPHVHVPDAHACMHACTHALTHARTQERRTEGSRCSTPTLTKRRRSFLSAWCRRGRSLRKIFTHGVDGKLPARPNQKINQQRHKGCGMKIDPLARCHARTLRL